MKKCKHLWRIKVELFLDIPAPVAHRVSKESIRSKSVRIDGANWERARSYCAKCGYSIPFIVKG